MAKTADPLAEFRKLSKPQRLKCGIKVILDDLEPADGKLLVAALDTPEIRHTAIVSWLDARGIKCAETTVGRHRLKRCSCADD